MTLPAKTIDGTINGHAVKVIFKIDQWFAKPNNHLTSGNCVNCPHFHEYRGNLEVHEDSADQDQFRKMYPEYIASGSYTSGSHWVSNHGKDLVVLPMETSADGFRIDTTATGSNLNLSGDSWCLMAIGKWGAWEQKVAK